MFKKILIANRGEVAVRIVRACHDLDIQAVAVFAPSDQGALHVRLADECVPLTSELGYNDRRAMVQLALETGADAVHPGLGFLTEDLDFVHACEEAGLTFIGPPVEVLASQRCKIQAMNAASAAGFDTPIHSSRHFGEGELEALYAEAEELGYPLVVKSCRGGRGRGARLVPSRAELDEAVRHAQSEGQVFYGDKNVFLEQAFLPAHQLGVQVLGDSYGNLVHLGERDGSVQRGNQKMVDESPAPFLDADRREQLWQTALDIARLFHYRSAGTVEFIADERGRFFFTEIKPRMTMDHTVTEMVCNVDIVREQIRLAAGEALALGQEDIRLQGWAMQCRITAEDPWNDFLPSPGQLSFVRLPGGPKVRVDTYAYTGASIPVSYDPIVAKVIVGGDNRVSCVRRMRRALDELLLRGIQTTLPLHQRIFEDSDFILGQYTTDFCRKALLDARPSDVELRDLAVAAAIAFLGRNRALEPMVPEQFLGGWHRDARRLPD